MTLGLSSRALDETLPAETPADALRRRRQESLVVARQQKTRKKNLRLAINAKLIDDLALLRGDLGDYERLISAWPVLRVLTLMRQIGPVRAHEIISVSRVSPNARMDSLSFAKRARLAELVEEARESAPL